MFDNFVKNQIKKMNDKAATKQATFIKQQSVPAISRMLLKHFLFKLGIKSAGPTKLGGTFSGQKNSNRSTTSNTQI